MWHFKSKGSYEEPFKASRSLLLSILASSLTLCSVAASCCWMSSSSSDSWLLFISSDLRGQRNQTYPLRRQGGRSGRTETTSHSLSLHMSTFRQQVQRRRRSDGSRQTCHGPTTGEGGTGFEKPTATISASDLSKMALPVVLIWVGFYLQWCWECLKSSGISSRESTKKAEQQISIPPLKLQLLPASVWEEFSHSPELLKHSMRLRSASSH